jgi:pimeloyl-ACP methyl ester carboxylesterase
MTFASASHLAAVERSSYGSVDHPEWLSVDWSQHLRWLTINGRRVNVLDTGQGEPIVFVHGHNVCWQHWLEQLAAFRHTHRVITFDLPGFGHSEDLAGPVSISAYASTVDAVMEQLGVERATIVGNSMGGCISAEFAISYPERVERLGLISPTGVSDQYMGLPAALIRSQLGAAVSRRMFAPGAPSPAVARTLSLRPRGRVAALGLYNGRPAARPDLIHPALVQQLLGNTWRPTAATAAVALATHDLRERLDQIQVPVLIVWGDRDNLVPLRCAHTYERLLPDARLLVYADTGHNAMIERPARFNADLAAFLAS